MAIERTFSIIKPDGVEKGIIGRVLSRFEAAGLKPVAIKLKRLSQAEAEGFYAVHRARPFFADLVKSMTCAPVVLMVLEGEGAIAKNREVMGATDPEEGRPGHHPGRIRHRHREEHGPRLRRPGDGQGRDRLLLPRGGSSRLRVEEQTLNG